MSSPASAESTLVALAEQVRAARGSQTPLRIVGGCTKDRFRSPAAGQLLEMSSHRGIVDYTPAELVVVARAGTPLADIEAELAARGQRLAFEPPRTGPDSTLGGMLAAGFAGPSRPWTAAVRDHVLGVTLLGDDGQLVRYGGQVMKNVAGYDVPRLMVGAWGTLGPIVEAALRVVPVPAVTRSFAWACSLDEARAWMRRAGLKPWPVSGLCHEGSVLHVRLEGAQSAVRAAAADLPDGATEESLGFFEALRDWSLDFFRREGTLWRVLLPANAEPLRLPGEMLWDWGGALRWLRSDAPAEEIRGLARSAGGSARRFDSTFAGAPAESEVQRAVEARIRAAFDSEGLFAGNAISSDRC